MTATINESFTDQRQTPSFTINEVIALVPPTLRKAMPSYIVKQPSLVLAQRLQSMGCKQEATMILQLLVQAEPCYGEALYQLGLDCNRRGKKAEAIEYMQRYHEERMRTNGMDPKSNADTLQFLLSTEGFAEPPASAPRAYVENLFDRFSSQFDERLLNRLAYKTPEHLFGVFCDVAQSENAFKNCKKLVDLGCGTGLAGKYFQSICGSMTGVDISSKMIEKSRLAGVYDTLFVSEIVAYLESETVQIDVFIATDVFIYFGDITPILMACRNRQNFGGLLAFSVEILHSGSGHDHAGFKLASTGRFQHEKRYLSSSAEQAEYRVMSCSESVLRHENGYDVNGYLLVLIAK